MTTIAGAVDLDALLGALAAERPIFHSEADLQHELAWLAHLVEPSMRVRLEFRPEATVRESVDILFESDDRQLATFVELKYLKAAWTGQVDGEQFDLPNTGAHDIVRYDVIKDLARLERFVAARPNSNGLMLCLTNDSLHWREPQGMRASIAEAFRIHHGAVVSGSRAWDPRAGAGTTKGRTSPLDLQGTYVMDWRAYSRVDNGRKGEFRLLIATVEPLRPGRMTSDA